MCIIFLIASNNPTNYKLILASNRDEFYSRKSLPLNVHSENPFAFSGLDMEEGREGGTWLGISGRKNVIKFGALLNLTGEIKKKKHKFGRGPIVINYINNFDLTNCEYSKQLINNEDMYSPFNLVTVEINSKNISVAHVSNSPSVLTEFPLNTCHGFGNSTVNLPLKKVVAGTEKFQTILENYQHCDKSVLVDKLMELLQCSEPFWPDEELLRRAPTFGQGLSKICVKMQDAGYGSRTRSVILVDNNNKMDFYEETMLTQDPEEEWKKTHICRQF